MLVEARADAAMVKYDRPDRAAAFDMAEKFDILATRTTARMAGAAHFSFVDFDRLAFTANRRVGSGIHSKTATMPKSLKTGQYLLARFLARAGVDSGSLKDGYEAIYHYVSKLSSTLMPIYKHVLIFHPIPIRGN